MKDKIFRAIFRSTLAALLLILLALAGALYAHLSDQQAEQLRQSLAAVALGIEREGLAYAQALDAPFQVTWIGSDGTVRYDSREQGTRANHLDREEIREAMQSGAGSSVRRSETSGRRTIYEAVRLEDGGAVRLSQDNTPIWLLAMNLLGPVMLAFFAALCLSLLIAERLTARIVAPIAALDLFHPVAPYPELAPLMNRIDALGGEVESQKRALAERRSALEGAEANRREFTANVSHELKTPLQAIMGRAELIENQLVRPEDLTRFAGDIRKEATRLLLLIEDILHLARLDERIPFERAPIPMQAVCQEAVRALAPVAERYGVRVSLEGGDFSVLGARALAHEIVYNLLDNAIKYNHPGGHVTLRLSQMGAKKRLSVSDDGIGIPESQIDRIFERFYRVDKSRSKEKGGTGLGLSIVKHAAEALGGTLQVDSALGVGTTVTLTFEPQGTQSP